MEVAAPAHPVVPNKTLPNKPQEGKAPPTFYSNSAPTTNRTYSATETTPLLPRNSSFDDEEASTEIAALMRGYPCS